MDDDIKRDLTWSKKLFIDQVWPICKEHCGGGNLIQMEGRQDVELAKYLDAYAGIDGWQILSDGMRGIASRIQCRSKELPKYITYPYDSFTIRMTRDSGAKTEFAKRLIAIKTRKFIFPWLTIQAYSEDETGPILSWGMAKTEDIIDFINKGLHAINRTSNAEFAVCYWSIMIKYGYKVKTWKDSP